ncbi:unnamed protein product, partial [Ectocarpus sp. 12 AP-2014]
PEGAARRKVRPAPRKRKRGVGLRVFVSLSIAGLVLTFLVLALSDRILPIPDVVRAKIEERTNAAMTGPSIKLGSMSFGVGRDGVPELYVSDIRLGERAGVAAAELNRIGAKISPNRLLRGELSASELVLVGAQITVRRNADGSFAFQTGQDGDRLQNIAEVLERVDRIFAVPALAALSVVEAQGIVLSLEDARSGRIWQATNATALFRRTDTGLSVSINSDVFNGTDQ